MLVNKWIDRLIGCVKYEMILIGKRMGISVIGRLDGMKKLINLRLCLINLSNVILMKMNRVIVNVIMIWFVIVND